MNREIVHELYCRNCCKEFIVEHSEYECPTCGSTDVFNCRYVRCDCGEKVHLNRFTNECYGCGKLYNGFGQELAPVSEWDPEDRYGTFGPQNAAYDY